MSGYTKLFSSILASSIWSEPMHVRIVWITMLAMADRDGLVEASIPGLADLSRVPKEDCREAVKILSSPDSDSRSKELNGRRIVAVEGGWQIVNYDAYRRKHDAEDCRAKDAARKARQRLATQAHDTKGVSDDVPPCPVMSRSVPRNPPIAEAAPAPAPAASADAESMREDAPSSGVYSNPDVVAHLVSVALLNKCPNRSETLQKRIESLLARGVPAAKIEEAFCSSMLRAHDIIEVYDFLAPRSSGAKPKSRRDPDDFSDLPPGATVLRGDQC